MSTYTLEIDIDSGERKILTESKYLLCIAKSVNDTYNVVFKGKNFLAHNTIKWTEKYKVFGVETFESGALVKASTEVVDIQFGQTAVFDHSGTMNPAKGTVDTSGKFKVVNEYGKICIGVMCDVEGVPTPIHVSQPMVTGQGIYEPKDEVLVWFSQTHASNTMFSEVISNAHVVKFQGATSKRISYVANHERVGAGHWVNVESKQIAFPLDSHPVTSLAFCHHNHCHRVIDTSS